MSTAPRLVEIRHGGGGDLASISAIMQEAFDPRYGEAWTSAQCMGMMSLPGVWLTVASVGAQDAGFALVREAADEAELLLLATRPRHRGLGVGGALLRTAIGEARSRGMTRMHLEVRAGNEAVHLYRREGFEKVGERRAYYRGRSGQLFDAQTFARNL